MKRSLPALIALTMLVCTNPTSSQPAEEAQVLELLADELQAIPAPPLIEPADGVPVQPDEPDQAKPEEPTTPPVAPPKPVADPGTLTFHLMDGTVITGKLETQNLPIKTAFGDLVVPITAIHSFSPGLASHKDLDKKIQQLITQLGDADAKRRDKAQAELMTFGPGLVTELQRHAKDPDAERKVRIATIIEELFANQDDEEEGGGTGVSLARLDTIVTEHFTVAGEIKLQTFNIRSKFGKLVVRLADIKSAQRMAEQSPETRRKIEVRGTDMAGTNYKKSGIRVNRGDKVIINAEGRITMTPWGNNSVSSPDGIAQNGMYKGNIPMGALAGRVGEGGEEFLVGSKSSFVAKKSGMLYLGFAMQPNWANYQFPGQYEVRIRVVPTP